MEMRTDDNFSEALREKTLGADITPPEYLWSGIRHGMARRKRAIAAISACCSCLVALLSAYGIYSIYTNGTVQTGHGTERKQFMIAAAVPGIISEKTGTFPRDINIIRAGRHADMDNMPVTHNEMTATDTDDPAQPPSPQKTDTRQITENTWTDSHDVEVQVTGKKKKNAGTGDDDGKSRNQFKIGASVSPAAIQYSAANPAIPQAMLHSYAAALSKNEIELEHSIPVSYGLSFSYDFTNRWSIYAGIDYTLYRSSNSTDDMELLQKLHYISIPIGLNFKIVESRIVDFYITAGGSVDKCVSGNVKYTRPRQNGGSETTDLRIKGIEGSLRAGVGLMLKIAPHTAIFAEPVYIRYFNGNTSITSYRTAHENGFNVSVGLRFNI